MRPPSIRQSALRCPLNSILGTEAHVRILRALAHSDIPIGTRELAATVSLQRSGVARACERLEDLGALESVGRSRSRQYRLATRFRFAHSLRSLFVEERSRAEEVLNQLRQTTQAHDLALRAAWIEGPVASDSDTIEDSIVVGVLVDATRASSVRERVWERLLEVQKAHDVTIELLVETEADLSTCGPMRAERLRGARPLVGTPPRAFLADEPQDGPALAVGAATHEGREGVRRAYAHLVAARLAKDPSIVTRALRHIEERLLTLGPGERLELQEWRDILTTQSVARVRRFLLGESERSRRLRQSLPFIDDITNEDRRSIVTAPHDGSGP